MTVARIALNGQADLIFIMVPLEVLVQRKKIENRNVPLLFSVQSSVFKTKHGWEI